MFNLVLLILSVYGASKLLTDYDGPFDVFHRLRNMKHIYALNCTVCTSVYVAFIFSLLLFFGQYWFITFLAVVGAIVFIEDKL